MVFVSVAVKPQRSAIAVWSITVAALFSRPAARIPSTRIRREKPVATLFLPAPLDTKVRLWIISRCIEIYDPP
jgi:hypothetical protein